MHQEQDKTFWISSEERIRFYLNDLDSFELNVEKFEKLKNSNDELKKELRQISYSQFKNSFVHWYCKHVVHLPFIRNIRILPYYKKYKHLHSLMNFFKPFDQLSLESKNFSYPIYFGETGHTDGIPCLKKSRRSDDQQGVIFNFRTLRLTAPCYIAQKNDIPWNKKSDTVIWRGATTGEKQRVEFVKKYFDQFDVGFASIKQKPHLSHLKKSKVTIKNQLQNKFIISLEGNDVASNLRWILFSNSVPIMPKPNWQSWIMESYLQPNVHYLELKSDLSNLVEVMNWAENHDEECQQIARNGKNYMSQFLDGKYDLPIQKQVLEEYAKRIH